MVLTFCTAGDGVIVILISAVSERLSSQQCTRHPNIQLTSDQSWLVGRDTRNLL